MKENRCAECGGRSTDLIYVILSASDGCSTCEEALSRYNKRKEERGKLNVQGEKNDVDR